MTQQQFYQTLTLHLSIQGGRVKLAQHLGIQSQQIGALFWSMIAKYYRLLDWQKRLGMQTEKLDTQGLFKLIGKDLETKKTRLVIAQKLGIRTKNVPIDKQRSRIHTRHKDAAELLVFIKKVEKFNAENL